MNNDTASLLSCQTVHALLLAIEQLLGAREAPQCASDARPRATVTLNWMAVRGKRSQRNRSLVTRQPFRRLGGNPEKFMQT